jgi:hypothetical protein
MEIKLGHNSDCDFIWETNWNETTHKIIISGDGVGLYNIKFKSDLYLGSSRIITWTHHYTALRKVLEYVYGGNSAEFIIRCFYNKSKENVLKASWSISITPKS